MAWLVDVALAALAASAIPAPGVAATAAPGTAAPAGPATAASASDAPSTSKPPAPGSVDACVRCHEKLADPKHSGPVLEVKESVHADAAVSCAGCHGGDARVTTERGHETPDFVAKPGAAHVLRICGGCHADAGFIREFDASLRVDQIALYRKSAHGMAIARGDETAATCVSCHGVHRIRPIDDADSPVRAENVAATCAKCHEDPAIASPHGLPLDVVEEWRSGVHAAAMAKGDRSAPTCNDCHGNHGARPPAVSNIHRVCGGCHAAESEMFSASVHAGPFGRLGLGECTECHSNHAIKPVSAALVGDAPDTACSRCHAPGSKGAVTAAAIRGHLDAVAIGVAAAKEAVRVARDRGVSTPEANALLTELNDAALRLPAAVHLMDGAKFGETATAIVHKSNDVIHLAEDKADQVSRRRRGYALSLFIIGAFALLLVLKIRRLDRKGRPGPSTPPTAAPGPAA